MFMIVEIIREEIYDDIYDDEDGIYVISICCERVRNVFGALLYPLLVPVWSIFCSAIELFCGKDEEEDLTTAKGLKMFEQLGEYFLFSIL